MSELVVATLNIYWKDKANFYIGVVDKSTYKLTGFRLNLEWQDHARGVFHFAKSQPFFPLTNLLELILKDYSSFISDVIDISKVRVNDIVLSRVYNRLYYYEYYYELGVILYKENDWHKLSHLDHSTGLFHDFFYLFNEYNFFNLSAMFRQMSHHLDLIFSL